MDLLGQSALLVSLVSFGLGFSVLARNVKNMLFLAYWVMCLAISLWALFFALEQGWGGDFLPKGLFHRAHLFIHLWLSPICLTFIRLMARMARSPKLVNNFIRSAAWSFSLLGTVALFWGWDLDFRAVRWLVLFSPAWVGFQVLHLLMTWQKDNSKTVKNISLRSPFVYWGALVVLCSSSMDHLPFLGNLVPTLGNLLLMIYLFFLGQAVVQQRFLHFESLLGQFVAVLLMALGLTLAYMVPLPWLRDRFGLYFLNSFAASALLLTLMDPVRRFASFLALRILNPRYKRISEQVRDFQERARNASDRESLEQISQDFLKKSLGIEQKYFYHLDAHTAVIKSENEVLKYRETLSGVEISSQHPILKYALALHSKNEIPVVVAEQLERDLERSAGKDLREFYFSLIISLRGLGGDLLIPFFDGDRMSGFVVAKGTVAPKGTVMQSGVRSLKEVRQGDWDDFVVQLPILYPFYEQLGRAFQTLQIFNKNRERERLAELGFLSAGLAHEIRNPLGAIKGAAQILQSVQSDLNSQTDSRFLKVIVEEVDRLNHVVSRFLDIARSPQEARCEMLVDINEIVSSVIDEMNIGENNQMVVLQSSLQSPPQSSRDISVNIVGVPHELKQVFINIIQNSLRAVREVQAPEVNVNIETTLEEVMISVIDNGHGIKKDELHRIFTPFFTTSPTGVGLGLSICERILSEHRGRLEVWSEWGKGAKFRIALPLVSKQGLTTAHPARTEGHTEGQAKDCGAQGFIYRKNGFRQGVESHGK